MSFSLTDSIHEAVNYSRVSTEDQADRKTIETQLEFGAKYCDLHEIKLTETYKDDGITGTIPLQDRPDGRRLLADAAAGKFKTLLIYKLDRLGRTARIILNAIYDLEQYGVTVRSMTEPFDTSSPTGRFLLTILAGQADLDRSNTLERLWLGANRAARGGKWLGGIVPYGYIVNEEKFLEINESEADSDMSEAAVIRMIYHMVAEQGLSTIKVANYLNAIGILPSYAKAGRQIRRGKRLENTAAIWRPARIRNMLVNTTYKGIHSYGKRSKKEREIIVRVVPAIISEETWDKAQQVLRSNQIEATRSAKRQYLVRGLIKCACCGLSFTGSAYNGSSDKPKGIYVCNGKISYRGPLQGKCSAKNVPQEWIENLVWQDCLNFIKEPGSALAQLGAHMYETKLLLGKIDNEIDLIQKVIKDKETEKQSILDLFRRQVIDAKDVELQLQKIASEKTALIERLKALDTQVDSTDNLSQQYNDAEHLLIALRSKIQDDTPSWETKREIVKALVREIRVETKNPEAPKPQASISICYSFSQVVLHTDRDSLQQ